MRHLRLTEDQINIVAPNEVKQAHRGFPAKFNFELEVSRRQSVPCAKPRWIFSLSAGVGAKIFPHALQKNIRSQPSGSNIW